MGCSSGSLKSEGESDPSGVALDYLIAGWSVEFFITMCDFFSGFIFTIDAGCNHFSFFFLDCDTEH